MLFLVYQLTVKVSVRLSWTVSAVVAQYFLLLYRDYDDDCCCYCCLGSTLLEKLWPHISPGANHFQNIWDWHEFSGLLMMFLDHGCDLFLDNWRHILDLLSAWSRKWKIWKFFTTFSKFLYTLNLNILDSRKFLKFSF